MLGSFCQDFTAQVGRTQVTVHYFSDRVCWEASGQRFCYDADMIIEFREFINNLIGSPITEIVNEFQSYFAVRRQRAFWIVETMLSRDWCVLEVVISPGCITDGDYVLTAVEWSKCLESVIDAKDIANAFISKMQSEGIKLLDHCGAGAQYVKPTMRYVQFGETSCTEINTEYETWLEDVIKEAENILYGG